MTTRNIVAVFALLASAPAVWALATEHHDSKPVPKGFIAFDESLRPVLDDPARFYWYEVNADATFYYQGETAALNALLAKFAKSGKADTPRELVLHGGPLEAGTLGGTVKFRVDWSVHVPGGFRLAGRDEAKLVTDVDPAVHVYVGAGRTAAKATAAQLAAIVADLDSDDAKAREKASAALAAQGAAARPALKAAAENSTSPEVRRRAKALLSMMPRIDLEALVVPKGVTVVGPDEVRERLLKGLKAKEYVVRGFAVTRLSETEPDAAKAVKDLAGVVANDRHEYVRRSAAGALYRLGHAARPALPALREGAKDADANVANACKAAIEAIEKATPDAEDAKRRKRDAEINEALLRFAKGRAGG